MNPLLITFEGLPTLAFTSSSCADNPKIENKKNIESKYFLIWNFSYLCEVKFSAGEYAKKLVYFKLLPVKL
ncbi:hypothetical protein GCM10011532_04780 [Christiangramia forsetii]|uniref:Uncharacterized protein n=1 Tax=Christiangramia forsetii TaxID=411153 RepID=A0ABQ1WCZ6_9FLAO|nr:hypothetical protein GCM10011532_04780 [Christiangramia forsetii]